MTFLSLSLFYLNILYTVLYLESNSIKFQDKLKDALRIYYYKKRCFLNIPQSGMIQNF